MSSTNKTGDGQYDVSAELFQLIQQFYRYCQTRDPEDLSASDIGNSALFAFNACALIHDFRDAQLDPEEVAADVFGTFHYGPRTEQSEADREAHTKLVQRYTKD